MEIRTLEGAGLDAITETFNEAFQDYFIPLQFTPEAMAAKMKGEGIRLPYSVGAFDKGRLVGFILHGYDHISGQKTVYNAGTGVIPSYRGRGLTAALYSFAVPLLEKEGIRQHLLEVIDNNHPAIRIYQKVGFETVRPLLAFKSTEPISSTVSVEIKAIESIPSDPAFFSVSPAWQNATASIGRDPGSHSILGAFRDGALAGFAAFVPASGRVKQCAVHPSFRQTGIGTALFAAMQQNSATGTLLITNVDERYTPAVALLQALGCEKFLRLYEMKLAVKG